MMPMQAQSHFLTQAEPHQGIDNRKDQILYKCHIISPGILIALTLQQIDKRARRAHKLNTTLCYREFDLLYSGSATFRGFLLE